MCVFSAGLLGPGRVARRIRRILALANRPVRLGWPGPGDSVGVWGRRPVAWRGEAVAARAGAPLWRIEDAFLRSIHPGPIANEPPLGLTLDSRAMHYEGARPSDLEHLLATHPLDETTLIARAHAAIARLIAADLSKYNAHDPYLVPPAPGYVLVIDQLRNDAAVTHGADAYGGGADALFRAMLAKAMEEHPGAQVVIRSHPESAAAGRGGHYTPQDLPQGRGTVLDAPISPWKLLEGAIAVYTVSSQMGFEAIMAGHRPCVFGQPFYAGWGLTRDEAALPRRGRILSRAQLFAGAMLLYPIWYDPGRDRLCDCETALDHLEAEARAFRDDRAGYVAVGMRLWKRPGLARAFGRTRRLVFCNDPARAAARARRAGRALMVWAGHETAALRAAAAEAGLPLRRVEDGFLRSHGLGAGLIPPLSLVLDDLGIYYDPTRASRLEQLIAAPPPPGGEARAARLIARLTAHGLSKYNVGATRLPDLPAGHRILVPGQVEDDASIRLGTAAIRRNLDLLRAARAANPGAVILYKPHPDVEAGLRPGALSLAEGRDLADRVVSGVDAATLLDAVDEVWTMTSLMGFEALLRGKRVTCLGAPFYAGWGLTQDLGELPARRQARPSLEALAHAALIAYPRYFDPITGAPCTPERAAEHLVALRAGRAPPPRGPALRLLAKAQGVLASHAWLWRR